MKNRESELFFSVYPQSLKNINGIHFTDREIDLLAFIVSGRSGKKIATCLGISAKTVENHTRNIMAKIECNSKESIIDFVEKSNVLAHLRKHYGWLLDRVIFEKSLQTISKLHRGAPSICSIVCFEKKHFQDIFISYLETHLNLAGIVVSRKTQENYRVPFRLMKTDEFIIYVLSEDWEKENEEFRAEKTFSHRVLFLVPETEGQEKYEINFPYFTYSFQSYTKYYQLIFNILEKILPSIEFEKIIPIFNDSEAGERGAPFPSQNQSYIKKATSINKKKKINFITWKELKKKKLSLFFLYCAPFFLVFAFFKILENRQFFVQERQESSVRQNLLLPSESLLLDRRMLMSQLEDKFKTEGKENITAVALVGVGGAGKTTAAHQFARQQKSHVLWEINAETKESLQNSFEGLAHHLAKTPKDEKKLRHFQDIKNPTERDEKILLFVQEHLKSQLNWFLIYDNVERFSDIQKYFPQDSKLWGQGKVILTTQNTNIQNNTQVNHVIFIKELSPEQKLTLFTKIIGHGENSDLIKRQKEKTIEFLKQIPPFPLDVSVAAYYLKTMNGSYAQYLEHLNQQDRNFTSLQENLLKEAGSYIKTRYAIITLSLQHLIKSHKEFGELLLFISLLDSQNIPKDLLKTHKGNTIVDNFIYHLKKHSLITNDSSEPFISLHRSTQNIIFVYLTEFLNLNRESQLIKNISYSLNDYLDKIIEQEDFEKIQVMTQHVGKILHQPHLLTEFLKELLEIKLGIMYYFTNTEKFHQMLSKDLNILKRNNLEDLSAEDASRIAHCLLHIGAIYTELRLDKEAEDKLERAVHIYRKNGEKDSSDLAWALSYLGNIQRKLGNFEKARDYLEKSIHLQKQNTENDFRMARTLSYLGTTYRGLGSYQKAIDTLKSSLALYKKHNFSGHFRVGWILVQLGNVYRDLGELQQAKDYLEKGVLIFQKHLPEDHISMGLAVAYLGNCYRELGDYEKSCHYLEQSLKIHQKQYDEQHVKMGWLLFNLASTYKAIGRHQEAQGLFDKVFKIYAPHHSEDNVERARLLRSMASICLEKANLHDAETFIQESLKILQHQNHIEAYQSLETLGEVYLKKSSLIDVDHNTLESQEERDKAIEKFNEALEITEKYFPKGSVHVQRISAKIQNIKK